MKALKIILFVGSVLFFHTLYLHADESYIPFSSKKSILMQLWGAYKVVLGSTMVMHSSYILAKGLSNNFNFFSKATFNTHCYDVLSLVIGAHTIYFGVNDLFKKGAPSSFLKIQHDLINIFAASHAVKLLVRGLHG